MTFVLDEFNVVAVLEEDTDTCTTAEEGIAHDLEETWEIFDHVRLVVFFELVWTMRVSISVRKGKRPKSANLQHGEGCNINGIQSIIC